MTYVTLLPMRPLPQHLADEAIRLYVDERMPATKAAARVGIGTTTLYRALQSRGIERRNDRSTLTSEQVDVIVARYVAGERVAVLATEHNLCTGSITGMLRRRKVTRPHRASHNRVVLDDDAVVAEYKAGMSQSEIGRRRGVSQTPIARILRRAGVPLEEFRRVGERHPNWKGGRVKMPGGYVGILLSPDDPHISLMNGAGYALEHRVVMSRALGRIVERHETVHHINGVRDDNRLENLQLRQGQHGAGFALVCRECGSHDVGPGKLI